MPNSLDRPETSLPSTPMEYAVLGMFISTVMTWLVSSSEASAEAAQREGSVSSFAERDELHRIAATVNSAMTAYSYDRQQKHACVEALMPDLVAWSRGLEARQMCVFMLNELRICLKQPVCSKEVLEIGLHSSVSPLSQIMRDYQSTLNALFENARFLLGAGLIGYFVGYGISWAGVGSEQNLKTGSGWLAVLMACVFLWRSRPTRSRAKQL